MNESIVSRTSTTSRTIWPGVTRGLAHEDLAKHLFTIAAMHARRAMTAAEDPLGQLDRATSIGTSVELLAKAVLALISPTLIAEKDAKSLLLYSGVPATRPHEAKTKQAVDCLQILKQSHALRFNLQSSDANVFAVRNFALHVGQVDSTLLDEALSAMARLNEEMLSIASGFDSSMSRVLFWGGDMLGQVDERVKSEREADRLVLDELKAAARLVVQRLEQTGLSKDVLADLAERHPGITDPEIAMANPDLLRSACPVCGYEGWLGYVAAERSEPYVELDPWHDDAYHFVDLQVEAVQFCCSVCGLCLDADQLALAEMGDARELTVEATREEIDALEQYQMDGYLEDGHLDR